MPWPSADQTVDMTENTPLPDSELIRREALQRSWQRDKEVSARRLRIRWTIWALCRYGLPLFFVLGTAIAVWVWVLPQLRATLATHTGSVAVPPTVNVEPGNSLPATPLVPNAPPATPPSVTEPQGSEASPTPPDQSDGEQDPIRLRPEGGYPSTNNGPQDQFGLENTDTTTTPNPALTPDIGPYSKEP